MSVVLCLPAHLRVSRSVPWPAPHGNASIVMILSILRTFCGTSALMHLGSTAQYGVVLYLDALSASLYIFLITVMLVRH